MKHIKNILSYVSTPLRLTAALLLLTACSGGSSTVQFHRFERLLFNSPVENLQAVLVDSLQVYDTPLLNVEQHNPQYMQALGAFVGDPTVRRIYAVTDSLYSDLG